MKLAYLALIPLLMAPEALLPGEFAASAQQDHDRRPGGQPGGQQGGGQHGAQPGRPGTPGRPGGPGGPGAPGGGAQRPEPGRPGNPGGPGGPGGGNIGRPQPGRPQPGRPGGDIGRPQPGRPGGPGGNIGRPGNGPRPVFRPGSGRPHDFRPMRRPAFRYPRGYSYRRWSPGLLLPALFLGSTYRFYDYNAVGVGPPPPGYYWVRYGPDLLLVQRGSRRIADVIYGAFY